MESAVSLTCKVKRIMPLTAISTNQPAQTHGKLTKSPCGGIWYTQQVEGLCLNWHAGSSPVGGISPTICPAQATVDKPYMFVQQSSPT